jgi:hypothetical protein
MPAVSVGSRERVKRIFDVCVSGIGLALSAPVWVVTAALIKLEDGGPVFYAHERVGRGGRRFKNWKFRSLPTPDPRDARVAVRCLPEVESRVGINGQHAHPVPTARTGGNVNLEGPPHQVRPPPLARGPRPPVQGLGFSRNSVDAHGEQR